MEEIREAYLEGWRLGLKALAIDRDGSKVSQPVSTKAESADAATASAPPADVKRRCRSTSRRHEPRIRRPPEALVADLAGT